MNQKPTPGVRFALSRPQAKTLPSIDSEADLLNSAHKEELDSLLLPVLQSSFENLLK
jgi:hypothetical protein